MSIENINEIYKPILNIIGKIGMDKFKKIDFQDGITYKYDIDDKLPFEIVFWSNEHRISFNIDDWYELLDSYLPDENEAFEVFEFIDTIFKNKIIIKDYSVNNSNKIYKKTITYTTKINNEIKEIYHENIKKFKFPWIKYRLINERSFKNIY